MLAVVLTLGAMPVYGTFASAGTDEPTVETTDETPTSSVEPTTPEPAAAPAPSVEPEVTPSQEAEASPTPSAEPTESPEPENTTYANRISGMLWLDMFDDIDNGIYAGDATRQTQEQPLADYTVYLYAENDLGAAVQTTTTDAQGKYTFKNIEPGKYIVGVKTTIIDGVEYLLPLWYLNGREGDNRFVAAYDEAADAYLYAYTARITVEADSIIKDIDGGIRTVPGAQPMAAYTIDLSTVTAGGTGYTYSGGVLTFTTAANSHTYTITGTTTSIYIAVPYGVIVNMTLDGADMQTSVSPIRITGTANITLSGTNTLTCTGTSMTTSYQAGLYVSTQATLTIDGTGTLNVTGGSGGAGIGGSLMNTTTNIPSANSTGTITINSGTVTAVGGTTIVPVGAGAGIGGGSGGNGGNITINGGTVYAEGLAFGAGIGGGGTNELSRTGGGGGTINITGGTVTATSGAGGAGIGGGGNGGGVASGGNGGNITISGGTVTATGGEYGGPGIGGGRHGAGGNIIISGTADVMATAGGRGAAGIGGGGRANASAVCFGDGGNITITGSANVTAIGSSQDGSAGNGAGIGGGDMGAGADITIDATATIKAYSLSSARPAIDATSVSGSGYYFNGYLTSGAISATNATTLNLYATGSALNYTALSGALSIDSLSLPAGYECFAYTTGATATSSNIWALDPSSNVLGGVVYTANNSQAIISDTATTIVQQVKLAASPTLGTLSHSNVTATTADLTSTGHSFDGTMGAATAFYYNTINDFTSSTHLAANWVAPGTSPYTSSLSNLYPNTMYYYTAYLQNQFGASMYTSQTFLTLPEISSWSPLATSGTTAAVSGNIAASANGQSITGVVVAYDTSNAFTSPTTVTLTSGAVTNGFTDTSFTADLTGLSIGTTYYVKIEVTNAGGTTTSTVQQFQAGYPVTEKFVDLSGSAVDASGLPDNTVYVTGSYTASGIPTSHTVSGDTCTYLGYKLDSYTTGDTLISGTPSSVTITGSRDVYYVYAIAEGSIKIEKYAHDGTTLLPGAEFKLEKLTGPGGTIDTTFTAQILTTGAGGSVTFANLSAGSYRITETKAPAGHELLTAAFEADIPKDITYAVGTPPADSSYLYSTTSGGNVTYHYYNVTYKVSDQASIAMPAAGATNTLPPYALWGGGLILLAALGGGILWLKRRRAYAPKHG